MKKTLVFLSFMLIITFTNAQKNMFTLSGGYAFAKIADVNSSGWRINALYELNSSKGKWAHGASLGYIKTSGRGDEAHGNSTYNLETFPIYYAPKIFFGTTNFQGFAKAAIGVQFSNFRRSAPLGDFKDNDMGMTLGGGLGLRYSVSKKIFLSAEYELLYLTNTYYEHNMTNNLMAGIGFRF